MLKLADIPQKPFISYPPREEGRERCSGWGLSKVMPSSEMDQSRTKNFKSKICQVWLKSYTIDTKYYAGNTKSSLWGGGRGDTIWQFYTHWYQFGIFFWQYRHICKFHVTACLFLFFTFLRWKIFSDAFCTQNQEFSVLMCQKHHRKFTPLS